VVGKLVHDDVIFWIVTIKYMRLWNWMKILNC